MINNLFLPISKETLDNIALEAVKGDGEDDLDISLLKSSTFKNLSFVELCSLYLLSNLPELKRINTLSLEKKLATLIETGSGNTEPATKSEIVSFISSKCSLSAIRKGREIASLNAIHFMPYYDVSDQAYLDEHGLWDYEFKTKYKHPDFQEQITVNLASDKQRDLYSDQHRIFSDIRGAVSDEHLQIQGYAGSGKTTILSAITEILTGRLGHHSQKVLVISRSKAQLDALNDKVNERVVKMTFGLLATNLIPVGDIAEEKLRSYQYDTAPEPVQAVAQELKLRQVSHHSPIKVANLLFKIIANFCWGRTKEINTSHIPTWAEVFTEEDKSYLVSHAELLWQLTYSPASHFPAHIPVRDYHKIKYASLIEAVIPNRYTHIIADESHDLSESMMDIIERSGQGFVALGDNHQAIRGTIAKRVSPAVNRSMTTSIRTPGKLADVVNFSLGLSPDSYQDEFLANKERYSQVEYYERPTVPTSPAAIWVDDIWEQFEWAERLSAENINYRILGNAQELGRFVRGCIDFFQGKTVTNVYQFGRYKTWTELMHNLQGNRSMVHINKLMEKGYSLSDWNKTEGLQTADARYVLGLYQNSRNHEFDSVMLAPAVIRKLYAARATQGANDKSSIALRSDLSSRLYLGITRSRHKLILPETFREIMQNS